LTLAALAAAAPALAQGKAPMDAAVEAARHTDARPRIIVRHRPGAALRLKRLLAQHGGIVTQQHDQIGALAVELHAGDLDAVVSHPDVLGVSANGKVRSHAQRPAAKGTARAAKAAPQKDTDTDVLRAMLGIGTSKLTGRGVGIALLDSGVNLVPDLNSKVKAYYDFTDGATDNDGYGHGTHLASVIAGSGRQSKGKHRGLAPGASLIVLKVLDENGEGDTSDVIAAIEFAVAHRVQLGIDIINLSLGHPVFEPAATDPLVRAVEEAVAAGIVVVASAGNYGTDPETGEIASAGIGSPANAPSVITVGATLAHGTVSLADDYVAPFSARGPTWHDGLIKPDIVAPGDRLVGVNTRTAQLYQNNKLRAGTAGHLRLSGTSVATAVTSAVIALMIQQNRLDEGAGTPLTPNTIKAALQYTALPVRHSGSGIPGILEHGAGTLNGLGAIQLARLIEPKAEAGAWWLEGPVTPSTTLGGHAYPWAQGIVWGDGVVWGDAVMYKERAWSQGIVWGDGVVWGDSVLPF
jgi:serine protease AprX